MFVIQIYKNKTWDWFVGEEALILQSMKSDFEN